MVYGQDPIRVDERMDQGDPQVKIVVEQEYGFRYWLWEVKASSRTGVKGYFRKQTADRGDQWYCTGNPEDHLTIGEWKKISYDDYKTMVDSGEYDAHAHIHQGDDSHLVFKEEIERLGGIDSEEVIL